MVIGFEVVFQRGAFLFPACDVVLVDDIDSGVDDGPAQQDEPGEAPLVERVSGQGEYQEGSDE